MEVHCTTCGEPWDVYHLWHEAVFETGLSHEEARAWQSLPRAQKLTARYRKQFRAAGWQFGQSVINVIRCPACPKDAKPNLERLQTKAALEGLLDDDEDGLAATFEDYPLMIANLPTAKFRLGHIVATPNALAQLTGEDVLNGIGRHQAGDWGDVDEHDRQANERALAERTRLFAVFHAANGTKFWIITEADRSSTCILLPEDY